MPLRTDDRSLPRSPKPPASSRTARACAALALCGFGTAFAGDPSAIYRIDDVQGEIHLSDRDAADAGVRVERIVGRSTAIDAPARLTPGASGTRPYATLVEAVARAQRLDPALIHAVISVESTYRPRAVSPRGASGLMQLMPTTAQGYGVTDIFDPRQNIDAGARHLRMLMDRYGPDLEHVLAAYNAGAGAVDRAPPRFAGWPNPETANYVVRVLGRYATLRAATPSCVPPSMPWSARPEACEPLRKPT